MNRGQHATVWVSLNEVTCMEFYLTSTGESPPAPSLFCRLLPRGSPEWPRGVACWPLFIEPGLLALYFILVNTPQYRSTELQIKSGGEPSRRGVNPRESQTTLLGSKLITPWTEGIPLTKANYNNTATENTQLSTTKAAMGTNLGGPAATDVTFRQ